MSLHVTCTPAVPEDIHKDGRWLSVHERFLVEAHEREPDVVFIGDSLLAHLAYTQMWSELFAPLHCLNFSISGDQTQHVLWRIQHGELDNVTPKVVVLLVGTNNVFNPAEEVAEGIITIVHAIEEKLPETTILVLSLLPRGKNPNPLREKNDAVNCIVEEKLKSLSNAQFVDITGGLVHSDGTISHLDLHDYLHLTVMGYKKVFSIVYEHLVSLVVEDPKPLTSA